jgi:DNA end-binding protein Ku
LPRRTRNDDSAAALERAAAPVRSLWSGTITFGLVSIPVDLLSAVRPRQTAMKLVDSEGHPLGRRYRCSKEGKELDFDDLVRGYETDDGDKVVITDEEFESVAPEMSDDIELRNFVPLEQIPPLYFQRPYFLAPAGRSAKSYHLLAATMERTGRVGVGSFVMRGHEYLVAIISDNGVLRADTLRYADEIRTPDAIGLPKRGKPAASKVASFSKAIEALTRDKLDVEELEDREAEALMELAESKQKDKEDVIRASNLEAEDPESSGAKVIDLMEVLRKSLSKNAIVTNAEGGSVISLAEQRAARGKPATAARKKAPAKRRAPTKARATRKRAKRA